MREKTPPKWAIYLLRWAICMILTFVNGCLFVLNLFEKTYGLVNARALIEWRYLHGEFNALNLLI